MHQLIVKQSSYRLLLLAVIAALMAGCAAADIDKSTDFTRYKTFGWGTANVKAENPVYESDLIDANIRRTVKDEFAKRGITYNAKNPDFLVSYQTYTEKKRERSGGYYGYPYYNPYRFYPFGFWGWGAMPMWGTPPRT